MIGAGISNIIELKLHRYKLKKQLKLRSKIDIMFNEADRGSQKDGHGDMFLGLEEVQALFVQQGLETSAEEVAALFERYDVDKSGKIDRAEFEDLGHKVQRLLGERGWLIDSHSQLPPASNHHLHTDATFHFNVH